MRDKRSQGQPVSPRVTLIILMSSVASGHELVPGRAEAATRILSPLVNLGALRSLWFGARLIPGTLSLEEDKGLASRTAVTTPQAGEPGVVVAVAGARLSRVCVSSRPAWSNTASSRPACPCGQRAGWSQRSPGPRGERLWLGTGVHVSPINSGPGPGGGLPRSAAQSPVIRQAHPYPVSRMALVRLAQATASGWRPSTRRS